MTSRKSAWHWTRSGQATKQSWPYAPAACCRLRDPVGRVHRRVRRADSAARGVSAFDPDGHSTSARLHGHALLDRELYAQAAWFTDPDRMRAARFEADHVVTTRGRFARDQAERALDGELRSAWGTGDEVYAQQRTAQGVRAARHRPRVRGRLRLPHHHLRTREDARRPGERTGRTARLEPPLVRKRVQGQRRLYDWAWFATASLHHHVNSSRADSSATRTSQYTSPE